MRKIISIFTVCFMLITTFSGCAVLQKLGLEKDNDELHPASSIVMNEDEVKKLNDKVPVLLYFTDENASKLKLEVRYIPMADAKKSVNNLASIIVKELIKGPTAGGSLKSTIPAGTQLRSPVIIKDRIASVDFSKEFVDKHPGGKEAEQLTIYSIVNSLTELKEIDKVKFLINGKQVKDFKGSFQFDMPFPRSTSLINKAVAPSGQKAKTNQTDTKTPGATTKSPIDPDSKSKPKDTGKDSKETAGSGITNEEDEAANAEYLE